MIFSNPPLAEIIAELRWLPWSASQPQPQPAGPGVVVQFPLASPYQEETYSKFSNEVAAKGFGLSERMFPSSFPPLPFQVVYRYRKPAGQSNFVYQLGLGLFSANALPPYQDWDSFRPVVQDGVQALLSSRHPSENREFARISLRYIDLFSAEFTEGKSSFEFANDILGFKLSIPAAIKDQTSNMAKLQAGVQLSMPLNTGLTMNLNFAEGIAAGKSGIVMNTEVVASDPTAPYMHPIMETFEKAHTSIRATFIGLTEKLRAKMKEVK
jgi:uncharacterized protein (TIGR04255 family)